MTCFKLGERSPVVAKSAWVAQSADVLGSVELHDDVSVWFSCVIRGDNETVVIGRGTNIQDASVLHSDKGFPLHIGQYVTVGHRVILHGCTIGSGSLIGMGAIVLNGAKIGPNCLVGAGALVTEGKEFPEGSMILGSPAKVVKTLTAEQIEGLRQSALNYIDNAKRFSTLLQPLEDL
jgi:carbonic anhydrase/acetyltransferase-like protein (isoleucine patch superfamily)